MIALRRRSCMVSISPSTPGSIVCVGCEVVDVVAVIPGVLLDIKVHDSPERGVLGGKVKLLAEWLIEPEGF